MPLEQIVQTVIVPERRDVSVLRCAILPGCIVGRVSRKYALFSLETAGILVYRSLNVKTSEMLNNPNTQRLPNATGGRH